jgi:hypothetical protein
MALRKLHDFVDPGRADEVRPLQGCSARVRWPSNLKIPQASGGQALAHPRAEEELKRSPDRRSRNLVKCYVECSPVKQVCIII